MEKNETEKRRRELLSQTRRLYSEYNPAPAVHPRYRNAYNSIYKEKDEETPPGTFGVRVIICCFLFIGFVMMDHYNITVADVSSTQVIDAVQEGVDIQAVWQEIVSAAEE